MFCIRNAEKSDLSVLTELISEYRGTVDGEKLERALFADFTASAMLVESGGYAGFCLWYETFSTDSCSRGMFVDAVYIRPAYRHSGLGTLLFENLARVADMRGYDRIEWEKAAGARWAGGRGADAPAVIRVEGEEIGRLWGHCHCHDAEKKG